MEKILILSYRIQKAGFENWYFRDFKNPALQKVKAPINIAITIFNDFMVRCAYSLKNIFKKLSLLQD